MSHIKILEDNLINKIAAGEVIESPTSVVKELIENAIDAKAIKIYIEIKKAGLELIKVEDNGTGMSKNDALLCFKRHATSKIKSFEDLINVSSMGFRGEALASIAAVSKIDLKTSTKDVATFVKMDAAKMVSISEIARTKGTSFDVKHLFFNVPVRRKFLKTHSSINSEIIKVVTALAMSHPEIEMKLVIDDKEQFLTPSFLDEKKEAFKKRVKNLLSKEFSKASYIVDYSINNIKIFGLIGSPNASKKTRSNQYLIINNRVVVSNLIAKFIKQAYATRISEDDFPIFAIGLD
ncbi:MAG: DNA mismatch repair protein MutL, partial [Candidatus Anoxychlamydiales bacterium]|nr:DNA mismatch repair protein MutL [Candidatus Anoxychlamydiales bacterium]